MTEIRTYQYKDAAPIEYQHSPEALEAARAALLEQPDSLEEVAKMWADRVHAMTPVVEVDMKWLASQFAGEIVRLPEVHGRDMNASVLALALIDALAQTKPFRAVGFP